MSRTTLTCLVVATVLGLAGCGSSSGDARIPAAAILGSGTSVVSPQGAALAASVPQGSQIAFIGDVIRVRGINFTPPGPPPGTPGAPGGKVFIGMNNAVAKLQNSLLTTPRENLPHEPFVFANPIEPGRNTVLEVQAAYEFISQFEILVTIPPGVACSPAFNDPVLRFLGDPVPGSSDPVTGVFYIVGPRCIASAPRQGLDTGGYTVTIHGDFFSPYTQIAVRYDDPADPDGPPIIMGNNNPIDGVIVLPGPPRNANEAEDDIIEHFVDRHTLVIPNWPAVVASVEAGLTKELIVDVLIFENIDRITGNAVLEPGLDEFAFMGSACDPLVSAPIAGEVPLMLEGTRNFEKIGSFTYLPTGVTGRPVIESVLPECGSEAGGNTVVIHGQQFDVYSVDLDGTFSGRPDRPGIIIECPPDSGLFQRPMAAILVDRNTIVLTMPECAVDVPSDVDICLRNKWTIDNTPPAPGEAGPIPDAMPQAEMIPFGDPTMACFEDVYCYLPIPPIEPPVLTAIYPAFDPSTPQPPPLGTGPDFGCERVMMVGDWFDEHTTFNGGVEFILPPTVTGGDPVIVQAARVILHNRNLIEVFLPRLPDAYYPLTSDMTADVRLRNSFTAGSPGIPPNPPPSLNDFIGAMIFTPTPDAGLPTLDDIFPDEGPIQAGAKIALLGTGFDTDSEVWVDGSQLPENDVAYVSDEVLIATMPAGISGTTVPVFVRDGGDSASVFYDYEAAALTTGPTTLDVQPNEGSHIGGYSVIVRGINFRPTTRVEFGTGMVDDGNFSPDVFFVDDTCLRVVVPEAFPAQIGLTVNVGAEDQNLGPFDLEQPGYPQFTFVQAQMERPQIHFVDTTVEVPPVDTGGDPALNLPGGDRMLIIGKFFDQRTDFEITKDGMTGEVTGLVVLTPNIAVGFSPASPDGMIGEADLTGTNNFGISDPFIVEYVAPPPPEILDVRNLDDGTETAPIDGMDRILIFGDAFFDDAPGLVITFTGIRMGQADDTVHNIVRFTLGGALAELSVDGGTTFTPIAGFTGDVTLVDDHIIGVDLPKDTFQQGPLVIEVTTAFGTATLGTITPLASEFELIGPQPPVVNGVFAKIFNSNGGEEAIFFGRHFTDTTRFWVKTDLDPAGPFPTGYSMVLSPNIVSDTVAIVIMPAMTGGMPPGGAPGIVRAEETDPFLADKMLPGDPFTESGFTSTPDRPQDPLYHVVLIDVPILLGVFPDMGSTDGGEQVLLLGSGFLKADGTPNVGSIEFEHPDAVGTHTYTRVDITDMPLTRNDKGEYVILNEHEILLITFDRPVIDPGDSIAVDVKVIGIPPPGGTSMLIGGYIYNDVPAEILPHLLGITPNETRLHGPPDPPGVTTSHLLSGHFLTSADRIVLTRPVPFAEYIIPVTGGSFDEVNDFFLLFVMPDLSGTFEEGDVLNIHAEKDVIGLLPFPVLSNTLMGVLKVTFAGPPVFSGTVAFSDTDGSAFGGELITITGDFFTRNSQVLFDTVRAPVVVFQDRNTLHVITPTLPMDAPMDGLDLMNIDAPPGTTDATVDVAVFTQGGWAVEKDAYTFLLDPPTADDITPDTVLQGTSHEVHIFGTRFVRNTTTVVASDGTITSAITVHSPTEISFDWTAPNPAFGTSGPLPVTFDVSTNHGGPAMSPAISVELNPFVTACDTGFPASPGTTAPTTGNDAGANIIATVTGDNFQAGGVLTLTRRLGQVTTLTEVSAFGLHSQFTVTSPTTIEFTVPFVFGNTPADIIDGSPNIGDVDIFYTNPNGLGGGTVSGDPCFSYIPSLIDFDDSNSYPIPPTLPSISNTDKISIGDMNGDGLPDAAILARQSKEFGGDPEAFVFLADSFGAGVDVNGDGNNPDFVGTFTKLVIDETTVGYSTLLTNGDPRGRGAIVRLADMDGDGSDELVIPCRTFGAANRPRVLIVNINTDGTIGTHAVIEPGTSALSVSGIAVGNFSDADSGLDIAVLVGDTVTADRELSILRSTAADLGFTDAGTVHALPAALDDYNVGFLAAGDFDDDGDDDLIWGQYKNTEAAERAKDFPIVVTEVNAAAGTIGTPTALTNLTGGPVWHIATGDFDDVHDGDEAVLIVGDEADGTLLTSVLPGGLVGINDPLSLLATNYTQTGFRTNSSQPYEGSGRSLGCADFDGDGHEDVAAASVSGEFQIFFGDGAGTWTNSGLSWTLPTVAGDMPSRVHGIAAGDLNGDGLAEVWMGDIGAAPTALVIWNNVSR